MDQPSDPDRPAQDADAASPPPGPPTVWQPVEEEVSNGDGSWGSLLLASLGSTLLGAVLALGILAYLNGGELEFRGSPVPDDEANLLVAAEERLDLLEAEVRHLTGEVEALHEALGDPPMEVVTATAGASPSAAPQATTPVKGGAVAPTAAAEETPTAATAAPARPRPTETALPDTPEPTAPRPRTPRPTATLRISP